MENHQSSTPLPSPFTVSLTSFLTTADLPHLVAQYRNLEIARIQKLTETIEFYNYQQYWLGLEVKSLNRELQYEDEYLILDRAERGFVDQMIACLNRLIMIEMEVYNQEKHGLDEMFGQSGNDDFLDLEKLKIMKKDLDKLIQLTVDIRQEVEYLKAWLQDKHDVPETEG